MSWKNERAEAAMRAGTESIRIAAQKKAEKESGEMKEVPQGKYMITFKANNKVGENEVKDMLDIIELFAEQCDHNHPNVSVIIEPVEDEK